MRYFIFFFHPTSYHGMEGTGLSAQSLEVLKKSQESCTFILKWKGECTHLYTQEKGLREGDPASCLLFLAYRTSAITLLRNERSKWCNEKCTTPGITWRVS